MKKIFVIKYGSGDSFLTPENIKFALEGVYENLSILEIEEIDEIIKKEEKEPSDDGSFINLLNYALETAPNADEIKEKQNELKESIEHFNEVLGNELKKYFKKEEKN